MNQLSGSTPAGARNILRIDIQIVNVDVPNNLQNIVRAKFTALSRKAEELQKTRAIKKSLTYINNRELRPIDTVLRMNPHPEVAFLGWSPPTINRIKTGYSASALRQMVANDPNNIRYRKAHVGQKLSNTITTLIGNIESIVHKSLELGLDVKLTLRKDNTKIYNDDDLIDHMSKQMTSHHEDFTEIDQLDLEFVSDWQKFLESYQISDIDTLNIMNFPYQCLIHVKEEGNDFIFDEQTIYNTFVRIWDIEKVYFDNCKIIDYRESRLIAVTKSVLVVLPREISFMMFNQMELEGISDIVSYFNAAEALDNIASFRTKEIIGVLCMQEDKAELKKLPNVSGAAFVTIDPMIDQTVWEKFKKLEFDISDPDEFNSLTNSLQQSLNEINIDLDPSLKAYVPKEFVEFLRANFVFLCDIVRSIVQGKFFEQLKSKVMHLNNQGEVLRKEFKIKLSDLEDSKKAEFELLRPIVDQIKIDMIRVKKVKEEITAISSLTEGGEFDNTLDIGEIDRIKVAINSIAEKQFILAQAVGNYIVSTLRQNAETIVAGKIGNKKNLTIQKKNRRVFNFSDQEWRLYSGREICYLTRNINIAKLIATLLRIEGIPERQFITLRLPNEAGFKADWVFYDSSVKSSELNNIVSLGSTFYDSGNVNELLTKLESQKSGLRKKYQQLEAALTDQQEKHHDRDEVLFKLSVEHDKLLAKIKKTSREYATTIQKYRLVNQLFISYNIFYREVFRKLNDIQAIIGRIEAIAEQHVEAGQTNSKLMTRASKQIIALTDIITGFYFSLSFLRFTTKILGTLPRITEKMVDHMTMQTMLQSKLKNKIQLPVNNCLFMSSNDFASERILENVLSMAMLQFRLTRDKFKVSDLNRYRSYLNANTGFIVIVLKGESDQLPLLRNIIENIKKISPSAAVFSLCQYQTNIISEYEMLRDKRTLDNIKFIKEAGFLADSTNVQPDNRLQITSLYLYAMA